MNRRRIFLALLLSVALVSMSMKAQNESTPEKNPETKDVGKVAQAKPYQLTIVIKEFDGNKSLYEKSYLLNVIANSREHNYENVRDGARIPYRSEKGVDYFDSGTNIDVTTVNSLEDFISVDLRIAHSVLAAKPDGVNLPLVDEWKMSVKAVLLPGKSSVIYTGEDSTTGHKVVVEAKAVPIVAK